MKKTLRVISKKDKRPSETLQKCTVRYESGKDFEKEIIDAKVKLSQQ